MSSLKTQPAANRAVTDDVAEHSEIPRLPRAPRGGIWIVLVAVLTVLVLVPLLSVQARALLNGGQSYADMLASPWLSATLLNTLLLGVGSVAIALVFGTFLAGCAWHLPGRLSWLAVLPIVPLSVPALALVTSYSFLLSPQTGYVNQLLRQAPWWDHLSRGPIDVYSRFWIIFITGTLLISFVYLFILTALRGIDASLIEAAEANGARPVRIWRKVILPLLRPSLVYSSSIVLLLGLGQFTAPLLLGRDQNVTVLTTEMYNAAQSYPVDYGLAAAYGSPLVLIGAILMLAQRRALKRSSRYETLSSRGHRSTRKTRIWPAIPILLYVAITLVLPLFGLLNVALANFYSGEVTSPATATLSNFRTVFNDPDMTRAIGNSIWYSVVAVLFVVPLGFMIAIALTGSSRIPRRLKTIVDLLTNVPLVMPGVLFGAGILFTYTSGPIVLYGTGAALVLAYVTIMIPFVARMQSSAMMSAGSSLQDSARVHGGSAWRTHARITVPLLRPALAASAALCLSILTHEFGASAMVRSTNTEVMGTLLLRYWSMGAYPSVAVVALLMCVITGALVAVSYAFAGTKALKR